MSADNGRSASEHKGQADNSVESIQLKEMLQDHVRELEDKLDNAKQNTDAAVFANNIIDLANELLRQFDISLIKKPTISIDALNSASPGKQANETGSQDLNQKANEILRLIKSNFISEEAQSAAQDKFTTPIKKTKNPSQDKPRELNELKIKLISALNKAKEETCQEGAIASKLLLLIETILNNQLTGEDDNVSISELKECMKTTQANKEKPSNSELLAAVMNTYNYLRKNHISSQEDTLGYATKILRSPPATAYRLYHQSPLKVRDLLKENTRFMGRVRKKDLQGTDFSILRGEAAKKEEEKQNTTLNEVELVRLSATFICNDFAKLLLDKLDQSDEKAQITLQMINLLKQITPDACDAEANTDRLCQLSILASGITPTGPATTKTEEVAQSLTRAFPRR